MCIAAIEERNAEKAYNTEINWDMTRSLWVPLMNANWKKENGTEYTPADLIELSFDKEEVKQKPKPVTSKEVKAALGSKFKKADGGK